MSSPEGKKVRTTTAILFTGAGLMLSACGGGGGGSSNSPSTPFGDLPSGYIFDYDKNGAKSLVAVDPTDPSIRYTVQAANTYHFVDYVPTTTSFDQATRTATAARIAAIVYESGGKLFKVSDTKLGPPIPVQISSASGINACPESWTNAPPTSSENSYIVIQTSGVDGNCGTLSDNQYLLARLNMSSSEAPIGAVRPIVEVDDETTQLPLGWLAASGGEIRYYDNSFQNPVTLSATFTMEAKKLRDDFLAIDNKVYFFTPSTGSLNLVHTGPSGTLIADDSALDRDYIYFIQNDSKLYRARRDGSLTSTLVYSGIELSGANRISETTNRVIFSNSNNTLYSVPKSATVANALPLLSTVFSYFVKGTRIYFDVGGSNVHSGSINEDGTSLTTLSNSYIAGLALPSTFSSKSADSEIIDKLIRVEGINFSSGSLAGATLKSIRLSGGTVVANLGSVPAGLYQFIRMQNTGPGDANFLHLFASGSDVPVNSLFINAAKANSAVSIN